MNEFNGFKNNPNKLQIFKDYYSPTSVVDEILTVSDPIYSEWVYYKSSYKMINYVTKEDIGTLKELWEEFKKFWQITVETQIMFDEITVFSDGLLQEWRNMYCDNALLNLDNKLELYTQFLDIWDFRYNSIKFMNINYQKYLDNLQLFDEFSKKLLNSNPEIQNVEELRENFYRTLKRVY